MKTAPEWISHLGMEKHPEGGYFREIYRSSGIISADLGDHVFADRNFATSIYFLLPSGELSKLHRLKSDEIWYYHEGTSVAVHVFYNKQYSIFKLGKNYENNEQLQLIIPAGAIFGAEITEPESFAIMGCMVTPGFHFDDFELIPYHYAIIGFEAYENIIRKLT